MTDQEARIDPGDPHAVVEAFIDGEAVDRAALRAALDNPAARDHLIDALILREAVIAIGPAAPGRTREKPRRVRWLAAAAAVVAVSVTGGYVAGHRAVAAAAPEALETTIDFGTAPAAPAPTHVVTLQPGVNWTDKDGARR